LKSAQHWLFWWFSDAGACFSKRLPYLCTPFLKTGTMYAIVDIAGQQLKVAKDQYVYTPKIEGETGTAVSFDKVLLLDNGSAVQVGSPLVKGAKVSGKILEQVKGDKLIVFKKKRRKGYAVKNGHRQQYTKVQIESIG
jgi:large subunit ribosomal protein L21